MNVVHDSVPDISHIARKQRTVIQKAQQVENELRIVKEKQESTKREQQILAREKIDYERSLRLISPVENSPITLGSSPLVLTEATKDKGLRAQFLKSKDIVELAAETTVSLVEEGKDFSKVKYEEKTYYVATKHVSPLQK